MALRVLRRQTAKSELAFVGLQIEGFGILWQIREECEAKNGNGKCDDAVDDKRLKGQGISKS